MAKIHEVATGGNLNLKGVGIEDQPYQILKYTTKAAYNKHGIWV